MEQSTRIALSWLAHVGYVGVALLVVTFVGTSIRRGSIIIITLGGLVGFVVVTISLFNHVEQVVDAHAG